MSLARLRPFMPIALVLVVQVVLCNVGLRLLAATPALGWLPKVMSGTGYLEDNRQRVGDAWQEYSEGRVSSDEYLCAIIGASNLRDGIDLKTLAAEAGEKCRFLGLGLTGLMGEIEANARVLVESDLRPDLVILGFGPMTVVDTKPTPNVMSAGVIAYLRQGDLRSAAGEIRKWFWFHSRRQDVSITVEAALLDARAWLLRVFKVQLRNAGAHRSPWRDMIKSDWPEHLSEASLRQEFQLYGNLGVYDVQTYKRARKSPSLLVQMIKQFRGKGAMVVLVLLPEHSRFRRAVPPEALDVLRSFLRQALKDEMPPMLDYRDAVPDAALADLMHANAQGRDILSRLLAKQIPHYLPKRAPLMKESGAKPTRDGPSP